MVFIVKYIAVRGVNARSLNMLIGKETAGGSNNMLLVERSIN
ncbi:hypothetical protein FM107_12035 [Sphingobacterium sp. JB170]|nr:hypothetical protein FM107_12035 [Sphingobacterium sp. JB170]